MTAVYESAQDTFLTFATITATHNDPQLCDFGDIQPQLELSDVTEDNVRYLHLATLGPEGDCPDTRLAPADVRRLVSEASAWLSRCESMIGFPHADVA